MSNEMRAIRHPLIILCLRAIRLFIKLSRRCREKRPREKPIQGEYHKFMSEVQTIFYW